MHLNYLITKSYVQAAARFDKHQPVFHDKFLKKEILNSLKFAKYHYEMANIYWEQTLVLKKEARKIVSKKRVDLDFLNDLVFRINTKDLDYTRIVRRKLRLLKKKNAFYNNL